MDSAHQFCIVRVGRRGWGIDVDPASGGKNTGNQANCIWHWFNASRFCGALGTGNTDRVCGEIDSEHVMFLAQWQSWWLGREDVKQCVELGVGRLVWWCLSCTPWKKVLDAGEGGKRCWLAGADVSCCPSHFAISRHLPSLVSHTSALQHLFQFQPDRAEDVPVFWTRFRLFHFQTKIIMPANHFSRLCTLNSAAGSKRIVVVHTTTAWVILHLQHCHVMVAVVVLFAEDFLLAVALLLRWVAVCYLQDPLAGNQLLLTLHRGVQSEQRVHCPEWIRITHSFRHTACAFNSSCAMYTLLQDHLRSILKHKCWKEKWWAAKWKQMQYKTTKFPKYVTIWYRIFGFFYIFACHFI